MRAVNRIVLHHSASNRLTTTAEDIGRWHEGKIGYHYVIEGAGEFRHTARRFPIRGAHAKGANTQSLGICLVGDNRKPGRYQDRTVHVTDGWVIQQINTTRKLIAACLHLMPWLTLHGHRHVGTTSTFCPGDFTEERLREVFL